MNTNLTCRCRWKAAKTWADNILFTYVKERREKPDNGELGNSVVTLQKAMADDVLLSEVTEAAAVTGKALLAGRKLMVAGNGGNAADSQHLVAEFVSRLTVDHPAMRAIELTTGTSILTAVGNDYSYDNVFERQIEELGQTGDVFLGISTSGNSKNHKQMSADGRALIDYKKGVRVKDAPRE